MTNHRRKGASLALVAGTSLAFLGASAGTAMAQGDIAIQQNAPTFRLNPKTLEPGCFRNGDGPLALAHVDVTQNSREAHVRVLSGSHYSVDQVLIPGRGAGYAVYNQFDTGSRDDDPDIDPPQEATDLAAPQGTDVVADDVIMCVSDHPDREQNEPYISDGLPGEVAAIDRPIIQPTIASLGMSSLAARDTYKVGFGYAVKRGYDAYWRNLFLTDGVIGPGTSFGDPQAWDTDGDSKLDHVFVLARPEQAGVSRFNDVDEYGEAYNNGAEKDSYGQPIWFDVSGTGDPEAYLHKSLPGVVNGGFPPLDSLIEAAADQTNSAGLHTFSAEGDLPLSWAVKPSLAPQSYGQKVTLTDDQFRAWNQSWQDYYVGKGAKPKLPLAPGTKSPDPLPHFTIVNPQVAKDEAGKETIIVVNQTTPVPAPVTPTQPKGPVQAAKQAIKPTVRAKLMRGSNGRYVQVHVRSDAKRARIVLQLLNGNKRTVKMTMKTVSTNKDVRVTGLSIGKQVKFVKATIAG